MSNLSCSLTNNSTSPSMKNLAFHSLLRWKMIALPILTTSLIHFLFKRLGECTFWELGSERVNRANALYWDRNQLMPKALEGLNLNSAEHFSLVSTETKSRNDVATGWRPNRREWSIPRSEQMRAFWTGNTRCTHRWMKTVDMPSDRAMEHACCPPAPPKHASTCRAVSWPRAWVRALIGRHMVSLATRMKPMATCWRDKGSLLVPSGCDFRNAFTYGEYKPRKVIYDGPTSDAETDSVGLKQCAKVTTRYKTRG